MERTLVEARTAVDPLFPVAAGPVLPDSTVPIAIRMAGVEANRALSVRLDSIEVVADGVALPVDAATDWLELDRPDHAWRAGDFALPASARNITLLVRLAPIARGPHGERVQARGAPLRIDTTAELLRHRGKIVLDLDVSRSVERVGTASVLLPHFKVHY